MTERKCEWCDRPEREWNPKHAEEYINGKRETAAFLRDMRRKWREKEAKAEGREYHDYGYAERQLDNGFVSETPTGLWKSIVRVGYDPDGREKLKWRFSKSKREALEKLEELRLLRFKKHRVVFYLDDDEYRTLFDAASHDNIEDYVRRLIVRYTEHNFCSEACYRTHGKYCSEFDEQIERERDKEWKEIKGAKAKLKEVREFLRDRKRNAASTTATTQSPRRLLRLPAAEHKNLTTCALLCYKAARIWPLASSVSISVVTSIGNYKKRGKENGKRSEAQKAV